MRTPIGAESAEPEPAHRRAEEPERPARRDARVQLRAARRRLLHEHDVLRQPLGQGGQHVAGPQRLARPGRRGRLRPRESRRAADPSAAPTERASSAHTAAGSASSTSSAGLRCASAGSSVTSAIRVPSPTNGPGSNGYWRNTPAPTTSTRSWPPSAVAHPRPPRGQVAGEQRVVLREPGARAERLLPDRAAELLRQLHQRRPGLGASRRPRPPPAPASAPPRPSRPARPRPPARRRARPRTRTGGGRLAVRLGGLRASRPSARSRAPARDPRRASCHARATAAGTSCARAGCSTDTG